MFAPPVKVARTQRLSMSSIVQTSRRDNNSSSVTLVEQQQQEPDGSSWLFVNAEDSSLPPVDQIDVNKQLSGVGATMAWVTHPSAKTVDLWSLSKLYQQQQQQPTPSAVNALPKFSPADDGTVLFAAEYGRNETVIFCTNRGIVKSLDGTVDLAFETDDTDLVITSFTVCEGMNRDGGDVLCAGTDSGLLLVFPVLGGQETDAKVVDVCSFGNGGEELRPATNKSWLSWLTGAGGSTRHGKAQTKSSTSSPRPQNNVVSCLCASQLDPQLLWCVVGGTHVTLVRCADNALTLEFSVCAVEGLARSGSSYTSVVALADCTDGVLALIYSECRGTASRNDGSSLVLATIATKTATVVNTVVISHVVSAASRDCILSSSCRNLASIQPADPSAKSVTVVFGNAIVQVNNAAGVRSPCSSEDVKQISSPAAFAQIFAIGFSAPAHENPSASLVILTSNGPSKLQIRQSVASRGAGVMTNRSGNAGWVVVGGAAHDDVAVLTSQRLSAVLAAVRVDSRITVDEAALNATEEILQHVPLHRANWARVDLQEEDANLFSHVTRSLHSRQVEHHLLLNELFKQRDIWRNLSPRVAAKLISDQEKLRCLIAIRNVQNHVRVFSSQQEHLPENLSSIVGVQSTFAACEASTANHCQRLLKQAIVDVADFIRSESSASGQQTAAATAAEIMFSKADHLTLLLRRLNNIIISTWTDKDSQQSMENRVGDTLAVATVFRVVTQTIDAMRSSTSSTSAEPNHHALYCVDLTTSDSAVVPFLWTGADDFSGGLESVLVDQIGILSDALVALHSPDLPIKSTSVMHQAFLEAITVLLHSLFRHHSRCSSAASLDASAFASSMIRRALIRFPFVNQDFGFPFGCPQCEAPYLSSKEAIVRTAMEFAFDFDALDVLYLFAAGSYAPDPELVRGHFSTMASFCNRSRKFLSFSMRQLLAEGREPELLALPTLLVEVVGVEEELKRFLVHEAPDLAWCLSLPMNGFPSLRKSGITTQPTVTVAEDSALEHRSRYLSMSKLAWIASDASKASRHYEELELDMAIVTAQKEFMPVETSNSILSVQDAVFHLLNLPAGPAWVRAASLASRSEAPLRGELQASVLRCTLAKDGIQHLLSLGTTTCSEKEFVDCMAQSWTGQILVSTPALRDRHELHEALLRACKNEGPEDTGRASFTAQVYQCLMGWIGLWHAAESSRSGAIANR